MIFHNQANALNRYAHDMPMLNSYCRLPARNVCHLHTVDRTFTLQHVMCFTLCIIGSLFIQKCRVYKYRLPLFHWCTLFFIETQIPYSRNPHSIYEYFQYICRDLVHLKSGILLLHDNYHPVKDGWKSCSSPIQIHLQLWSQSFGHIIFSSCANPGMGTMD